VNISAEVEEQGGVKRTVGIDLAVCILFYEKLDQTIECIQSFLPSGVTIYVLNNGSSLSARQALGRFRSRYNQIKIFDSDINLGVGAGRNYLVTHTTEKWLFFVDSDIVVKTTDWLQKFTQYVYLNNDVEVFIPRLFNIHENSYSSYRSIKIVGNKAFHDIEIINDLTNTFPGGASLINRELFNRLGFYDDKMFIGFEDFEYCIRAILLGKPVKAQLIHDIELVHNHRQAKKDEDKNAVLTRYDIDLLDASFNRMTEKHNIILESNWKKWVTNQRTKVLNKRTIASNYGWKQWVPSSVKRILRKTLVKHRIAPTSCTLFMTDKCNFKCLGCYRSVIRVKESKEMTLATVQKVLSLYPSINSFCVAGLGEPTLCSNFVDILRLFEADPATEIVVIIGEIGGSDEERAAEFIAHHMTKSAVAFVAGRTAPRGKRMGHAGAIISRGRGTAEEKIRAFEEVGVPVARHPGEVAELVAKAVAK